MQAAYDSCLENAGCMLPPVWRMKAVLASVWRVQAVYGLLSGECRLYWLLSGGCKLYIGSCLKNAGCILAPI